MTKEERNVYNRQYRKDNKEAVKIIEAQYRKDAKEITASCSARWYKNNKKDSNARSALWYGNNKEVVKAYSAQYRKDNKERIAVWCKLNPDKVAANNSHRKFKLKQATPRWSEIDEIKVMYLKRDEYRKTYGIPFEVDHIIPIRSDTVCGLHVLANLQLLDKSLNSSKTNTYQPDW